MGSTLKNRPKTSFMARSDAAIPPEPARKRRREIPSFLLADSASSLMRSSNCFCFLVCGTGMYSPFETISVGHWEGDTLVVDTVGFNGRAWIDLEGHPFTEKTHITERYRRPDLGHLEVDDPSSYVKPWTIKRISDLA